MARTPRTADENIRRLRPYNLVAGSLHLVQAVVFAVILTRLTTQVTFGVTADYLAGAPGFPIPPERVDLFAVNVGAGVVAFLALSALFHFLISSPAFFGRYSAGLRQQHNYFRWVEYALSSSIMIWLIAQTTGITDVAAL
ncbi:MAG TPA: heliorhodopsin HeR, partial [Rhodoglobus sp.]|nr:heliorhodopsin HeR [Rhodoglobus sp.]